MALADTIVILDDQVGFARIGISGAFDPLRHPAGSAFGGALSALPIREVDLGSRGIWYRVQLRVGGGKAEAEELYRRLHSGGQWCEIVMK
jgi:hypothetical protein